MKKQKSSTTTTTKPNSSATTAPGVSTSTSTTTTTTTAPNDAAAKAAIASCDVSQLQTLSSIPTTQLADDKRDACVVLPLRPGSGGGGGRLYLGPTKLTGKDVDSASSTFVSGTGYTVDMNLKDAGLTQFNALGQVVVRATVAHRSGRDRARRRGVVEPRVPDVRASPDRSRSPATSRQTQASDLAKLINYGALPVQLKQLDVGERVADSRQGPAERGHRRGRRSAWCSSRSTCSCTTGCSALVVIAGLMVSATLTFCLITFLGSWKGLTLTLAGVTGLIVSVGITVDSYVVYFERLKDEVRTGKTVRSSVDRGFTRSFKHDHRRRPRLPASAPVRSTSSPSGRCADSRCSSASRRSSTSWSRTSSCIRSCRSWRAPQPRTDEGDRYRRRPRRAGGDGVSANAGERAS